MLGKKETISIKDTFYINDKPIKIISGSIHYFRTVPEYWTDRLQKLKAMGCNTVETYVPWNLTNPEKAVFDFTGILNLRSFVEQAEELGLYLILRPGPYICAEWEFGGHPAWLLEEENLVFRSDNEPYLRHAKAYLTEVIGQVKDKQVTQGGNIILVQVENEYGYFGEDTNYLQALRNIMIEAGIEVPFVTSDGPWRNAYQHGSLPESEALPTFNFGSGTKDHYDSVKSFLGNRPFMVMEFWIGWFDHWGGRHAHRDPQNAAKELDEILSRGHVNFYMFQGGTNFAFTNGANDGEHHNDMKQRTLLPDVTSYDYDALLTEAGDMTEKYFACQKVISKYVDLPDIKVKNTVKKAYGTVTCQERTGLFPNLDNLSKPHRSNQPKSMETFGQSYGYILYRSSIQDAGTHTLDVVGGADRIHYFLNQELEDIRYDSSVFQFKTIAVSKPNTSFDLLVENMGRVNFGYNMNAQRKGIRGPLLLDGKILQDFTCYPLPMDHLDSLDFSKPYEPGLPSFSKFTLSIDSPQDTFLSLDGFKKGFVVINGHNIGRYYFVGPQQTLYVPAPYLIQGDNEIIVFESDGCVSDTIEFVDTPNLG